jgi:uncharacterized protein (UPF0218 family)
MAIRYSLTPKLRLTLKQPLGILIRGSFAETMKKLKNMVDKENPPSIIAVGDTVSRNLTQNRFQPKLAIVDNKCMRKNIQPTLLAADTTVHVKNPQGAITEEAISTIQDALKSSQRVKIVVDGEEDLLTLIAIAYASENSFVVYGQPYEGIVVVKVTAAKKADIAEILKTMEASSKN